MTIPFPATILAVRVMCTKANRSAVSMPLSMLGCHCGSHILIAGRFHYEHTQTGRYLADRLLDTYDLAGSSAD